MGTWGLLGLVDDYEGRVTRVYYVDLDYVRPSSSGGILSFLVVEVRRRDVKATGFDLLDFQYDCRTESERRLGTSRFNRGGQLLEEDLSPLTWAPIQHGSAQKLAYNLICRGETPRQVTKGLEPAIKEAEAYVAAPKHLSAMETPPLS